MALCLEDMKILIGLLLLVAVSSNPVRADPAPSRADMEKFLDFFEKLVDGIVADHDNCPRMAADANHHMDDNADFLKRIAEANADVRRADLPKELKARVDAVTKRMMKGIEKCVNDKAVQAALERLDFKHKR